MSGRLSGERGMAAILQLFPSFSFLLLSFPDSMFAFFRLLVVRFV